MDRERLFRIAKALRVDLIFACHFQVFASVINKLVNFTECRTTFTVERKRLRVKTLREVIYEKNKSGSSVLYCSTLYTGMEYATVCYGVPVFVLCTRFGVRTLSCFDVLSLRLCVLHLGKYCAAVALRTSSGVSP